MLAIKIFLVFFIAKRVGSRPAIPGIADTVISLVMIFFLIKLFKINIFLFLNFFFTFSKINLSLIINIFGLYLFICLQISLKFLLAVK